MFCFLLLSRCFVIDCFIATMPFIRTYMNRSICLDERSHEGQLARSGQHRPHWAGLLLTEGHVIQATLMAKYDSSDKCCACFTNRAYDADSFIDIYSRRIRVDGEVACWVITTWLTKAGQGRTQDNYATGPK